MKIVIYIFLLFSCNLTQKITANQFNMTAEKLLGNSNYQSICYGGYRGNTRSIEPTLDQIKEDLVILHALNFKFIRTYNVHLKQTENVLKAIRLLQAENPNFEMYLFLGAWIDCKNAWTESAPIHNQESERNQVEIKEAVRLANAYPDIVKVISVGNEAMVKWATSYYVEPEIILKWVNYLQDLKKAKNLPKDLWITSSDNFASWGGGDASYHTTNLVNLYKSVDYISIHTYPMHDTHYNPVFWGIRDGEMEFTKDQKIQKLIERSVDYAKNQYFQVQKYMKSIGVNKPIHIGETGWASQSNELYGDLGSQATDEFKAASYYRLMKNWTDSNSISMFYFEAFDENWKDAKNPNGSENHFGLFTLEGNAKYLFWDEVDKVTFKGLSRDGKQITKTYKGNFELLFEEVKIPKKLLN
jgi:exo-beta-1,3-glucanase (GH17 family)